MNRILCGIFAVAACFILSEALTCNKCPVGVFGTCLIPSTEECPASRPNCFTGEAKFPGVAGFLGLNTQGCIDNSACNKTDNGTILTVEYFVTRTCCSTDKCNPVSGASTVRLSLTAAASAALVASMWGSWQF